jgi:hypothetical protein
MKVMTEEELLLFLQTRIEAGDSLEQALKDARLLDDLLEIKRLSSLIVSQKRKFRGRHRQPTLSALLETRLEEELEIGFNHKA